MFLAVLSLYFAIVACIIFGVISIYFAIILRKKYKKMEDEPEDKDYFDATKLDYDEDVYYIGDANSRKKQVGKTFFSKVSVNAPAIALFLLGFGFLSIGIVTLIKSFL